MKKIVAICSALIMALSLASCSDKEKTKETTASNETVSQSSGDSSFGDDLLADFEVNVGNYDDETTQTETTTQASTSSSGFSGFGGLKTDFAVPSVNYELEENNVEFEMYDLSDIQLEFVYNINESDIDAFKSLSEVKLNELLRLKNDFIAELFTAFTAAGIKVKIDESSGEIVIDNSVLFGGDSAVITEQGKAFLDKFIAVYASVVCDEKYKNFISEILVEGHTAPLATSTYESGLPLSKERADNVAEYCSAEEKELANLLEPVGCSNSRPIKNSDGSVNLEASRRVAFRFIINIH